MNGVEYVYEPVSARALSGSFEIPSGATVVDGFYFIWDDGGFTGNGWLTNVQGGPTQIFFGANNDQAVEEYLNAQQEATGSANLNAVFSNWQLPGNYTDAGVNAFLSAVGGLGGGCATVEHK